MTADINSITVTFGHGIKREEYGPTKKAEVTLTAAVAAGEDGGKVLDLLASQAMAKVAFMLNAPKPDTVVSTSIAEANTAGEKPAARRGRPPKDQFSGQVAEAASEPDATSALATAARSTASPLGAAEADITTPAEDEWSTTSEEAQITDKEILDSTSAAATRLGDREKVKALINTFNDKPEGHVFKVQDIPQTLRRDYLTKLAALT